MGAVRQDTGELDVQDVCGIVSNWTQCLLANVSNSLESDLCVDWILVPSPILLHEPSPGDTAFPVLSGSPERPSTYPSRSLQAFLTWLDHCTVLWGLLRDLELPDCSDCLRLLRAVREVRLLMAPRFLRYQRTVRTVISHSSHWNVFQRN